MFTQLVWHSLVLTVSPTGKKSAAHPRLGLALGSLICEPFESRWYMDATLRGIHIIDLSPRRGDLLHGDYFKSLEVTEFFYIQTLEVV